ncbi:MAG: DUF1559 domain-containing protein [Planctomycetota bacterium]|nr:DUF1559 domain-containing protein [Planctomycetota bacterium]
MRRRGFTLVEFAVVAAIVAVTLSISLPAIQEARQQSRQLSCKNNLKQIGLALHNYHDVYGGFPPGWVSQNWSADTRAVAGWQVSILPFIEQINVYKKFEFGLRSMPDANELLQTVIPVYRCPADATLAVNPFRDKYGTSNYSGNYGDVRPPRFGLGRESVHWPGAAESERRTNGMFWCNSMVRMRDITDGTSYTIFVGERGISSLAGIWAGAVRNRFEDDVVTDCSDLSRLNESTTGFSSSHPNGANLLRVDGSAFFLSNKVESRPAPQEPRGRMGVYQMLANRHDGNVIPEDF